MRTTPVMPTPQRKPMPWNAAAGAAVLFLALIEVVLPYSTYHLESDCVKNGSVTYWLSANGEESAAILQASARTSYSVQMDCRIALMAPPNFHVLVSLREIYFRRNMDGSCLDYIEIDKVMCEHMVRLDEERHFPSEQNVWRLKYHTDKGLNNKTLSGYTGFTLVFTAFRKGAEGGGRNISDVFHCSNDYYIWSGLTCDGHNNCGDLSDEEPNGNSNCAGRASSVLVILGVLIVSVLVIMCLATLICSKNERVRALSARFRTRTLSYIPRIHIDR